MRSVHFNDLREKLRVKLTQIFKVDMELFFRVPEIFSGALNKGLFWMVFGIG